MLRQIVLDTETTGLSTTEGHRIIEIGCVELINRRFTGNHFHYYINPERDIDQGALAVHGITLEFLADKPTFKQLAQQLIDYLIGAELIIHNAPFDVGFLDYELGIVDHQFKRIHEYCQVIDSLQIARQKHPGQPNSLDALCKRYQVDNSDRTYHGALLDAKLLAEVYLAMTGGQTTLFTDTTTYQAVVTNTTIERLPVNRPPLPIIQADATEQALHAERVAAIATVSGKNLWQEKE